MVAVHAVISVAASSIADGPSEEVGFAASYAEKRRFAYGEARNK